MEGRSDRGDERQGREEKGKQIRQTDITNVVT
jgi:hypothetical protein